MVVVSSFKELNMTKAKFVICAGLLTAFAVLTMSCGAISQGVQAGKEAYNLTLIGQAYKDYCSTNSKGPKDADELMKSTSKQEEKDAIQQAKDGKFTIIWNVNLSDPTVVTSGAVLGYAPAPINNQRVVLLTDGQATNIPETTFQSKPKADTIKGKGK
jgi:hypothetical protein